MNNIIFLDVDGVIVSGKYYHSQYEKTGEPGDHLLDPEAIAVLARICKANHAGIVVTSSWRSGAGNYDKEYETILIPALERAGIDCIGETTLMGYDRGWQILEWLKDNPRFTGKYVVIDDDTKDIEGHIDSAHFFHTRWDTGLLSEHEELISKMFREQKNKEE